MPRDKHFLVYIYMIQKRSTQRRTFWKRKKTKRSIIDFVRSIFVHEHFSLPTLPSFRSSPASEMGEYRIFLPAWPARKMKIKERGGMEKRKNERSRVRGKIESTQTPFFLSFFFSLFVGQAEQQGADIPRWFRRIGSTNKLREQLLHYRLYVARGDRPWILFQRGIFFSIITISIYRYYLQNREIFIELVYYLMGSYLDYIRVDDTIPNVKFTPVREIIFREAKVQVQLKCYCLKCKYESLRHNNLIVLYRFN